MALKPPARGGSSSGTRQGITRRRRRLGELLVAQTYGDAASSVLADWVLASTPKAANGTVTGTITLTGTVTGSEGSTGTVTGETTYSGTVAGTKAAQGVTASEIVYSGVITGTAYDPTPPAPTQVGGGGRRRLLTPGPKREQALSVTRLPNLTRSVSGQTAYTGSIRGSVGHSGTTAGATAVTGTARGTASRTSPHITSFTTLTGTVRGWGETNDQTTARQQAEERLLLLL